MGTALQPSEPHHTDGTSWARYETGTRAGEIIRLDGTLTSGAGELHVTGPGFEQMLVTFLGWAPAPIRSVGALVRGRSCLPAAPRRDRRPARAGTQGESRQQPRARSCSRAALGLGTWQAHDLLRAEGVAVARGDRAETAAALDAVLGDLPRE
jgi:hypothetical protein